MIYFDNAATTPISTRVLDKMMPYLKDEFGNPSSMSSLGNNSKTAIDEARKNVKNLINATSEQSIIFTSGGSEANSLAITGLCDFLTSNNKWHIITSNIEHKSVLNSCKFMENRGFEVTYLNVNNEGKISIDDLKDAIRDDTGLITIMYVNNEIGSVNDIKTIGEIAHKTGILFHTDCVQATGSVDINVQECNIDMLSISGHKIHAPKGVGCLFVKNKEVLNPIIFGGQQEFGLRGGTENVPGIVGFGEACKSAKERLIENNIYTHNLVNKLRELLLKKCTDIKINGAGSKVLNIMFKNIDAETLIMVLDNDGVVLSAGSACNSKESIPSYVLKAIGLTDEEARSSVRVSFSLENNIKEVYDAVDIISKAVGALRAIEV